MATFNRSHLIKESLDSIHKQTFKEWELLVIDDGSKDGTKEVVENYSRKDRRVTYHRRPEEHKKGLPGCRNYGLNISKGSFVVFFDDDDIAHPDNLMFCVNELENKGVDYCRYLREVFRGQFHENFDRSTNYKVSFLGMNNYEEMVLGDIPFNSCQVMWRKSCFLNNYFNEDLMYAEEWECYLRILSQGLVGANIEKTLFYGRKHPNSNTGEYYNSDAVRKESKSKAVKLVLDNLERKNLLSSSYKKHFVRLGFFLKDFSVVSKVLNVFGAGKFEKLKYAIGYYSYPLVKRYFNMITHLRWD
jgi:glycosyltransferase involved in cell wall biosynthesis